VEPSHRRFQTGKIKSICDYQIQEQIGLRAMLRTTHLIVDDCYRQTRYKDPGDSPIWRTNCRIGNLASPSRVCPDSRFVGEGDWLAKNMIVTQRRKDFR
jgi:hypothetical protein